MGHLILDLPLSTTCITQISVEKIETTLCVSSGKGLNPGNSVKLVEARGVWSE